MSLHELPRRRRAIAHAAAWTLALVTAAVARAEPESATPEPPAADAERPAPAPSPAHDETPPEKRCALLLALRDQVQEASTRLKLYRQCMDESSVDETLLPELMRLSWNYKWQLAALTEAFGTERFRTLLAKAFELPQAGPSGPPRVWSATHAHRLAKLLSRRCVKEALLQHIADSGDEEPSLMAPEELDDKCPGDELVALLRDVRAEDPVLWMVFTQSPLRRVSLDTSGTSNLHFDLKPLPLDNAEEHADAPDEAHASAPAPRGYTVDVGDWSVHIAVLPKGPLVTATARAEGAAHYGPMHRAQAASRNRGLAMVRSDSMACLDIRATLSAEEDVVIFVDGHLVQPLVPETDSAKAAYRRYFVEPGQPHRLQVVLLPRDDAEAKRQDDTGAKELLLVDRRMDRDKFQGGADCIPLDFNLARSDQVTMLLTVGDMCEKAGLDPEVVRLHITGFLGSLYNHTPERASGAATDKRASDQLKERFIDLQRLRAVEQAMTGGATDANRTPPSPDQASRGARDFRAELESLAQQRLYVGFDTILNARMSCSRRTDDAPWDYSFAVTAHRPGRAQDQVGPYTRTTSEPDELSDVIREPLAELYRKTQGDEDPDAPYVWLAGVTTRQPVYQRALLTAETRAKETHTRAFVQFKHLDDADAHAKCKKVGTYRQLRSTTTELGEEDHQGFTDLPMENGRFVLPDDPGWYLLRGRIRKEGAEVDGNASAHEDANAEADADTDSLESAYRCVEVVEPPAHLWAAAMFGHQTVRLNAALRDGVGWRVGGLLGYRMPGRRLRFGLGGGYSLSWREQRELSSWDDARTLSAATTDEITANGQLPFSWKRHSLVFFPSLDFEIERWRRWTLWTRGLLMIEGAVLTGKVPEGLNTFTDEDSSVDVDTNAMLMVGSNFQLGARYALTMFVSGGMYAFDDALFPDLRRQDYDAAFELGVGVGFTR